MVKFFCNNKKIKINILARTHSEEEYEKKKLFKNFFDNAKIIYENKNPYKWIDKYEYIITNDSTLGIENIAEVVKVHLFVTLLISIRLKPENLATMKICLKMVLFGLIKTIKKNLRKF